MTAQPTTPGVSVGTIGSSMNDTSSCVNLSLWSEQSKKSTPEAMNPPRPPDIHCSPVSPLSASTTRHAIAYADRPFGPQPPPRRTREFYKFGNGVENLPRSNQPGWVVAWGRFLRDMGERVVGLFRGPEDTYADLHGRGAIEIGVAVVYTITAVENQVASVHRPQM
jgi:hypothetical protein